jgi:hypothetical protein
VSGFRGDVKAQHKQADRAALLLQQAAATLHAVDDDETEAERAQRYRGAAVLASSAALEIAVSCGWSEAAVAVELHGLDGEEKHQCES